jgi:hypothetical protein
VIGGELPVYVRRRLIERPKDDQRHWTQRRWPNPCRVFHRRVHFTQRAPAGVVWETVWMSDDTDAPSSRAAGVESAAALAGAAAKSSDAQNPPNMIPLKRMIILPLMPRLYGADPLDLGSFRLRWSWKDVKKLLALMVIAAEGRVGRDCRPDWCSPAT